MSLLFPAARVVWPCNSLTHTYQATMLFSSCTALLCMSLLRLAVWKARRDLAAPIQTWRELRPGVTLIPLSDSCAGVGKSTVAVNLAYTLAQMGAKVGIFDADVYGPSLPTMVSPEVRVLQMNPETRQITPTEFEGVKLVSFGFAGQGSAIMRGPMVSGESPADGSKRMLHNLDMPMHRRPCAGASAACLLRRGNPGHCVGVGAIPNACKKPAHLSEHSDMESRGCRLEASFSLDMCRCYTAAPHDGRLGQPGLPCGRLPAWDW